jgi:APA family basic amino acid/polyamine antiporter
VSNTSEPVKVNAAGTRKLGKIDLLSLAVGQTIGAGVITMIGPAIGLTGRSAWLAFAAAVLFGIIINIPFFFLGSTLRLKGGQYSMMAALGGDLTAGMFSVAFIAKMLIIGNFGKALGVYANSLWPAIDSSLAGIIAVSLFYFVNLLGIDFISKLQNLMVGILIIGLGILVVAGFGHLNGEVFNFSGPEFFTGGGIGFTKAMFLLVFSTTPYYFTTNYGGVAKNATKDIPWAMIMTVPVITLIYVSVAIVNSGTLPLADVIDKPLTILAQTFLNKPLFIAFMVLGPFMVILTTLNAVFVNFSVPFVKAAEEGWLPKWFAKKNSRGTPWRITLAMYVVAILPLLFRFNIQFIVNNTLLVTYALMFFSYYAIWQLPKKFPRDWAQSPLHCSNRLFYGAMVFTIAAQCSIIIYAINELTVPVVVISILAMIICAGYAYLRYKSGKVHVTVSVEGVSEMCDDGITKDGNNTETAMKGAV